MKTITAADYKEKLRKKTKVVQLVGIFKSRDIAVDHRCKCGTVFKAVPKNLLDRKFPYCVKCNVKATPKQKTASEEKFLKALGKKFPDISCSIFRANHTKTEFSCQCGNVWQSKPYELLKLKHGCPRCAQVEQSRAMAYTLKELKALIAKKNGMVELLTTKRSRKGHIIKREVDVRCKKCSTEWSANIGNLLHKVNGKSGCPSCAKRYINGAYKTIKLAGKNVKVQGYEPQAIEYLIEKGISEKRIKVFTEGKVETVPYTYLGKSHEYWPDIRVGKTLYEVKSIRTLLVALARNKAKAKACEQLGFAFKLLLISNKGVAVELPKDWLKWKPEQVEAHLRKHTLKKLRILAMDPGTSNYAWSVLEVERPFKAKLVATGMIQNTLKTLTQNLKESGKAFYDEVQSIKEQFGVDHIILERFQARGMKGTTIELVNVMIGIIMGTWKKSYRSFKLITAAQWKNEWNRNGDLKAFYEKVSCTVHQADSIGIGLYGAAFWFDEKPFETLKKLENQLIRQVKKYDMAKKAIKDG